MKRYELVSKRAFTLIEVMVAVMIVSVVIAALFKLRGDTNHLFSKIQESQKDKTFNTFLLWNSNYGLNKKSTNMYRLVEDFVVDDDLRRELKAIKVGINYSKIEVIELDSIQFEIGKTEFEFANNSMQFYRVILR